MEAYLWVGIGSALGGMARFGCSGLVARHFGEAFPWGTLVVNVVGSFVIGVFGAFTAPESRLLVPAGMRVFVMVGFCGGYTTFSSFSLQTLALLRDGEWLLVGANVIGSVLLCMVSVWLGYAAAAALSR